MNTLKALLAALLCALAPGKGQDNAPLLEIVRSEARAEYKLQGSPGTGSGPAVEAALQGALREAIRRYLPGVPESRLARHERQLLPAYRSLIESYAVLEERVEGGAQFARVEARIRGEPLRRRLFDQGIRTAGEHFELQALVSELRGGLNASADVGGGASLAMSKWSRSMLGGAARYYWTDDFFNEFSLLVLKEPVRIGTYRDAGGGLSPVWLTQYSPLTLAAGFKLWDWRGLRATTIVGYTATRVRGKADPRPAGVADPKERTLSSWALGAEAQWTASRWLGLGARAEYRPRTRFDVFAGQTAASLFLSGEVLVGF